MPLNLPGLPPGVVALRFGQAADDEFELFDGRIAKGPRGMSQIVVEPAEGWEFRYDITSNAYRAVQKLERPSLVTVRFRFEHQQDKDASITALKAHSAFVEITEEDGE